MRKYITQLEWNLFFSSIDGEKNEVRNRAMFNLMYFHGLRVSELLNIKFSDVQLNEKTIYIKRLKNGLSTVHPLQPSSIKYIHAWIQERKKINSKTHTDYFFISVSGKKISRQWIYELCKAYSKKAKLNIDIHPHMLRHGCGYALANQGLDTRLIQDYLGHKNIQHTVLYTASNPRRFKQAWKITTD